MITINGAHNTALCFTTELDELAEKQIRALCDFADFKDSKIRIMPDVHGGAGCTIGTTMTLTDKVVPAMVGVDIGCGMETVRLEQREAEFEKLDALIRAAIPAGREVRGLPHPYSEQIDLTQLRCAHAVNLNRAARSIGTLGGGNHFIELDRADDKALYLVVHSGSRHLGKQVALYYGEQGRRALWGGAGEQQKQLAAALKHEGRSDEIQAALAKLKKEQSVVSIPSDLVYVQGQLFSDYIHDMRLVQRFAKLNRKAITDVILTGMGFTKAEEFTTIHNYIDVDSMILRKGAVSAQNGEKLLIPINMRDGSLICTGRGNPDWNFSAPHGAGRHMSRKQAFETLSMQQYREEMANVYTTCVVPDTLDESPMAYKSMDEITAQLEPTAHIEQRIKPVYNFKASN